MTPSKGLRGDRNKETSPQQPRSRRLAEERVNIGAAPPRGQRPKPASAVAKAKAGAKVPAQPPRPQNPLQSLANYGQSVWLDYIRHCLLTSGRLKFLIEEDGLKGVTSNPSIFEKAIVGGTEYVEILRYAQQQSDDPKTIYETLAIGDIKEAADILWPVYQATKKIDGYVSMEVSPRLAHDTAGTLEEARRLWARVNKKNLMIKVPATAEGLPAIRQLISEGINVNVTLLFSVDTYAQVADAYLSGLEALAAQNRDLSGIASVASFFVSRIDVAVDKQLEQIVRSNAAPTTRALAKSLMGQVAVANAKLAYLKFLDIYRTPRWAALAAKGAHKQRVLWASTSTKNPAYSDVYYVEELIGPETVDTIPPATLNAFREHGRLRSSLTEGWEEAHDTLDNLKHVGVNLTEVTRILLDEGVELFKEAFDKLLTSVAAASKAPFQPLHERQQWSLPQDLKQKLTAAMDDWRMGQKTRRLWQHDASLWTGADEANWLGWLTITDDQLANVNRLLPLADEVKQAGFQHILLLGMGGSSLCPEVLSLTYAQTPGFPQLLILDSTDPAEIRRFAAQIDFRKTIFIVSSKSGGTLEPNILMHYFLEELKKVVGAEEAGSRFIAITDPGSKLQQFAEAEKFRHVFFGMKSIGGRYSALSDFGMVPATAMGLDLKTFLSRTEEMVRACSPSVPLEENPGVMLGLILGIAGNAGRDKITLVTSPGISDLGAWLEQLLAESTGKSDRGLIPVAQIEPGDPGVYGNDRLFCYIRDRNSADPAQDAAIEAIAKSGHPVVRIDFKDKYDLGQEFFRWEIATATAGSLLHINAFNQPDVEASKVATRQLTSEYEAKGSLPAETPLAEGEGMKLFTDARNAAVLNELAHGEKSVAALLRAHLGQLKAGDYFALLAFVDMNDQHKALLLETRRAVRDQCRVATCLGFGPRFLHSTGQAYKGGPNSGVFIQVTCDDATDLSVPGQRYTFGVVKAAQGRGDFDVLAQRGRRALRVHLGPDVPSGLSRLRDLVFDALKSGSK